MDGEAISPRLAQEARLLVALLRSARLSLLFGEPGSEKSAFLQSSLLPLLQRRAEDQPPPVPIRENSVVVPFPDRRARSGSARRKREVVVVFDDWSGPPLPALHASLWRAAASNEPETHTAAPPLTESIRALSERLDLQFIVILDRFEEFLRLSAQREGITEFTDALVEALNAAPLPASFLLSMDEAARPALAGLRRLVPGFDDFSLKLPAVAAAAKSTPISAPIAEVPATPAPVEAAPAPRAAPHTRARPTPPAIKQPTPVRAPIKTQDVYALIENTLSHTASDNDCEPFQGSQPGALAPERVAPPPAPRVRKPKKSKASAWPEEFKAEPAAPPHEVPPEAPRRRRQPKPTLIGRCTALLSRWWRSPRKSD
ncbi:MAG: hypothetical protein CFE40_02260 [Burkholderiales bacterium PBB1]|nr:MAG: hypothetical protein CFE40_02260 [Burkholderiales bacterium PBB1]